MCPRSSYVPAWLLAPLGLVLSVGLLAPAAEPQRQTAVRIGVSNSLTRHVPDNLVQVSTQPLRVLIEAELGRKAEFHFCEPAQLPAQLAEGRLQLAVLYGFELAWARKEHTKLTPLAIAVNQRPHMQAHLFVRQDATIKDAGGLKGQALAWYNGNREHCRLFRDQLCEASNLEAERYFGRIATHASAEDALDEVVDGTVQAAIVDNLAVDCYQRRKPGRFAQLKEVVKSESFPATAVVYHTGTLEDGLKKRCRDSLLNIKQTLRGKQALLLFKMTGFEPVPEDYEKALANIVKAYPPPAEEKTAKTHSAASGGQ